MIKHLATSSKVSGKKVYITNAITSSLLKNFNFQNLKHWKIISLYYIKHQMTKYIICLHIYLSNYLVKSALVSAVPRSADL